MLLFSKLTDEWIEEYNTNRPHEALKNLTPFEWKKHIEMKNLSNLDLSE